MGTLSDWTRLLKLAHTIVCSRRGRYVLCGVNK
jgi:hypothetical protein